MSSVAVKSEDARTSSPTSADVYVPEFEESPDLRIRSMSLAEAARKEWAGWKQCCSCDVETTRTIEPEYEYAWQDHSEYAQV